MVSGFSIESEDQPLPTYRAVLLTNGTKPPRADSDSRLRAHASTRDGAQGQNSAFNGEDGTIVLHGELANGTAIESRDGSDVVLKNVFVRGAKTRSIPSASDRSWEEEH